MPEHFRSKFDENVKKSDNSRKAIPQLGIQIKWALGADPLITRAANECDILTQALG